MKRSEYFELPEATDPTRSFRASVTLQDSAKIRERDVCLRSFLELMNDGQYEMTFDEHPCFITRFDVDLVKKKIRIFARRSIS